jgi:serine protease SohB
MAAFFSEYGLFLLEVVTVVGLVLMSVLIVLSAARRSSGRQAQGIHIEHLNKQFEDTADILKRELLGKDAFKKDAKVRQKQRKREQKEQKKSGEKPRRARLFVLDFKGDIRASATASLREEITAVLSVADEGDHVLLRLENSGGTVHEHGLAASQLLRLRQRGLRLLVAVDKVAASGGYLMACVADHVIAAPFAIVGSIGVIAQLPNFHRLLEEKGVDFEQVTAGRYKRTLTMFGENTEEGREKLKDELEEVHQLFKGQIAEYRPQVDLEAIATGEHWYGMQALELKLVDELRTSDDFLTEAAKDKELYRVSYQRRRTLPERLMGGAESLLAR